MRPRANRASRIKQPPRRDKTRRASDKYAKQPGERNLTGLFNAECGTRQLSTPPRNYFVYQSSGGLMLRQYTAGKVLMTPYQRLLRFTVPGHTWKDMWTYCASA